ncbi:MAG: winged helix-turn-helix domain-containing protein [Actinomycetota bacterium]
MGPAIIGRDAELDAIYDTLRHTRHVTIVGPGGAGKTTLAAALVERLGVEAHWIELAAVEADADARAVALRMLGARDLDTFVAGLDGDAVVVLDNCEHQLEAAAELATDLLAIDADLRVVATSRVDLGTTDEIRYPIGPLSTTAGTDGGSAAGRLFVKRSLELGAAWADNDENRAAVEAIVQRLDGIPLAIELAAAQAVAIGPITLAPMLDAEPLDILVDARGQHRSVRAAVATSFDRLDEETAAFFSALSVVGFPFDLELAGAVGQADPGDALRRCNHLVRESLLSVVLDDDRPGHFRILEPIRDLARERLSEPDRRAAESRYIESVAAFADAAVARAISTYDTATLAEAGRRFPHIVRTIELAILHDPEPDRVCRIFIPLLAPAAGPRAEIVAMSKRILDRWPDLTDPAISAPPLRAEAAAVMAHTAALAADVEHAHRMAAVAIGDPDATDIARLLGLRARAMVLCFAEETDDSAEAAEALDAAITAGDAIGGGPMRRELRTTRLSLEPFDDAVHAELNEMAVAAAAEDDLVGLTWTLVALINGLVLSGDVAAAREHLERGEARARVAPDRWTRTVMARCRGLVESAGGDWSVASGAWLDSLEAHIATGDAEGVGVTLRIAASGAEHCGRPDVADRLWALRPAGRANTAMPLPFREAERAIVERNPTVLPVPMSRSVPVLREVFGAEAAAVETAPAPGDADVIRFGDDYELDLSRRELREDGHVIHVEPQVFDVLSYLASNAGRVVTRDELLDGVWGTRFVTAAAVSSRIRSARAATGDDGKRQVVIRTVHGHGFEFVSPINR